MHTFIIRIIVWTSSFVALDAPIRFKHRQSTPNIMITAANSCIFLNAIWTGLRTWGTRQPELLHSLTVKLTATLAALRQAAEEKKKDLAGCPTQRIDDEQHVDTESLHSYIAYAVSKIITAARREGSWQSQTGVHMTSGMSLICLDPCRE